MITPEEEDELDMLTWRAVADLPMSVADHDRWVELSAAAGRRAQFDWVKISVWGGGLLFCAAFWYFVGRFITNLVMP